MPTVAFNICCPRDCVSRHDGGTAGAPLKPLRDDSALRILSTLGQQMLELSCENSSEEITILFDNDLIIVDQKLGQKSN